MPTAEEIICIGIGFTLGVVVLQMLGFEPAWRAESRGAEIERKRLFLKHKLPQYSCPRCWTEYHNIGDHDISACNVQ